LNERLYRLILVVLGLYWLAIFIGTHLPPSAVRNVHVSDKLQHLVAYAILTVLLRLALGRVFRSAADWMTISIVLAYGAVDEWLQPLVNRGAELADWFADAAGAAVGISLCGLLRLVYTRLLVRKSAVEELAET